MSRRCSSDVGTFLAAARQTGIMGTTSKRVLAVGLSAAAADFSKLPGLTPVVLDAYIEQQLERVRAAGYDLTACLVDGGATSEAALAEVLHSTDFDCVVFGAGIRDEDRLVLFEKLLNVVHALAPNARICFNRNPADTLEAVQRWV